MTVVVSGSIATDYLMSFPGKFREQLVAENLDRLSVSFLVDSLTVRRGGVGANIAFGMAQLGLTPVLLGSAGCDFGEYRDWLDAAGVDTTGVYVAEELYTARFLCTTDQENNQIASFYPGAMAESSLASLRGLLPQIETPDMLVVAPSAPDAMAMLTDEARELGIPFAADPSQQLARLDGAEIEHLVRGASYLLANDYEIGLLRQKTGWTMDDIMAAVEVCVMTRGAHGCTIYQRDGDEIVVPAVPEERIADPTGVGDGFRSGLLAGQEWGLSLERSAQVGSLLATYVLEQVGTQEYTIDADVFVKRFRTVFGDAAADDVAQHVID